MVLLCVTKNVRIAFESTEDMEQQIVPVKAYFRFIRNQSRNWPSEWRASYVKPHRVLLSCILAAIYWGGWTDFLQVGDVLVQCYHDSTLCGSESTKFIPKCVEEDAEQTQEEKQDADAGQQSLLNLESPNIAKSEQTTKTAQEIPEEILLKANQMDILLIFEALRILNCTNDFSSQPGIVHLIGFWFRRASPPDIQEILRWPTVALIALGETMEISKEGCGHRDRDVRAGFQTDDLGVETLIEVGGLEIQWTLYHEHHLLLQKPGNVLTVCWFPVTPTALSNDAGQSWYRSVSRHILLVSD